MQFKIWISHFAPLGAFTPTATHMMIPSMIQLSPFGFIGMQYLKLLTYFCAFDKIAYSQLERREAS